MHFDPRPRPIDQSLRELSSNLSLPVDEGLECDRVASRADGVEHCWEEAVAIDEWSDFVPCDGGWGKQAAHRAKELFVLHREQVLKLVLDTFLMRGEEAD